jgi:hypothetical protein
LNTIAQGRPPIAGFDDRMENAPIDGHEPATRDR